MKPNASLKPGTIPEKFYRCLLFLYPSKHRHEYGNLMLQLFRDQYRALKQPTLYDLARFWARITVDLIRSSLLERIAETQRISIMDKLLFSSGRVAFIKVFLLTFLLVNLIVIGITLQMPKTYLSMARMDLGQRSSGTFDPYLIQTKFEQIQSGKVLRSVIEKLNLQQSFGKQIGLNSALTLHETEKIFRKRLDLRQSRNTSLLEIRVYGPDSLETAKIANSIAQEYINTIAPTGESRPLIIDQAEPSMRPVSPNVILNILLGAVSAAILGLITGLLAKILDVFTSKSGSSKTAAGLIN